MKKILIVGLVLALAGVAFAQDFTLTGDLNMGLQFKETRILGADSDKGEQVDTRPWMRPYNDDQGYPFRLRLVGSYQAENFGVKFRLRTNNLDAPYLNYGFGWFSAFNGKLRTSIGRIIDTAPWATEGAQTFYYDDYVNILVQIKPFEGLNVGFTMMWPDEALAYMATPTRIAPVWSDTDGDGLVDTQKTVAVSYGGDGVAALDPIQTLLESSFGFKYANDQFSIAGGFQLDSDADGGSIGANNARASLNGDLPGYIWGDILEKSAAFSTPWTSTYKKASAYKAFGAADIPYTSAKELGAYIGFAYKGIENLTAALEAQFYNLGAFGGNPRETEYPAEPDGLNWKERVISPKGLGIIWINEKFTYKLNDKFSVRLDLHEYLFGGKYASTGDDDLDKKDNAIFKFHVGIKPSLSYIVNDKLTATFAARYDLKPDFYALKTYVQPGLTYKIGAKATLTAWYQLHLEKLDKVVAGPDPKTTMRNILQLDVRYSF